MRHAKKGRALGTDASHTRAMLRSLAAAVLTNERIKTTEARAKEVRPLVENIITWGKRGDVHSRRLALAELGDRELVHKVFADIAPRYAEREGGYTRILKLGPRKGDAAPMVILELVD
ncbi:MAG: 50S ribosomal protein L17 [Actinomycetia bacterium]|nr:50S ribosomal protein L17 [Actinomycetes bacterium]